MDKPSTTSKNEAVVLLAQIVEQLNQTNNMLAILIERSAQPAAQQPAAAAAPAAAGYTDFNSEVIIMTYNDEGKQTFKIQGKPFDKFGIRVYPEVLEAMGINIETLKPGPNPFVARVRALNGEKYPKKVIGFAEPSSPAGDPNEMPF